MQSKAFLCNIKFLFGGGEGVEPLRDCASTDARPAQSIF